MDVSVLARLGLREVSTILPGGAIPNHWYRLYEANRDSGQHHTSMQLPMFTVCVLAFRKDSRKLG